MLNIEQKQKIYEELLELDCPDLLAALIAERATGYPRENTYISDYIWNSFVWAESLEGNDFWHTMQDCFDYPETKVETPELVIEEDVPIVSDYELPAASGGWIPDGKCLGEVKYTLGETIYPRSQLSEAKGISSLPTEAHTKATPLSGLAKIPVVERVFWIGVGLFSGWGITKILSS